MHNHDDLGNSTGVVRQNPARRHKGPYPKEAIDDHKGTPLCDCPEPCGCYAAGKDKAYFEVLASLDGPPHAEGCGRQPCQVKRACLQKEMTLMARSSPGLFELVDAWALERHTE